MQAGQAVHSLSHPFFVLSDTKTNTPTSAAHASIIAQTGSVQIILLHSRIIHPWFEVSGKFLLVVQWRQLVKTCFASTPSKCMCSTVGLPFLVGLDWNPQSLECNPIKLQNLGHHLCCAQVLCLVVWMDVIPNHFPGRHLSSANLLFCNCPYLLSACLFSGF
jgi:hypothetical protein